MESLFAELLRRCWCRFVDGNSGVLTYLLKFRHRPGLILFVYFDFFSILFPPHSPPLHPFHSPPPLSLSFSFPLYTHFWQDCDQVWCHVAAVIGLFTSFMTRPQNINNGPEIQADEQKNIALRGFSTTFQGFFSDPRSHNSPSDSLQARISSERIQYETNADGYLAGTGSGHWIGCGLVNKDWMVYEFTEDDSWKGCHEWPQKCSRKDVYCSILIQLRIHRVVEALTSAEGTAGQGKGTLAPPLPLRGAGRGAGSVRRGVGIME